MWYKLHWQICSVLYGTDAVLKSRKFQSSAISTTRKMHSYAYHRTVLFKRLLACYPETRRHRLIDTSYTLYPPSFLCSVAAS